MTFEKMHQQYKITGLKGFRNLRFTESSNHPLSGPQAVEFAGERNSVLVERNSVLQSVREALAVRIEAYGQDHSDDWQWTRTAAILLQKGEKRYVAFDDHPDEQQNVLLAHIQEYEDYLKDGSDSDVPWTFPAKNKIVSAMLKRARKSGRFVDVTGESDLELAVDADNGESEFGQKKIIVAACQDMAEPYARLLKYRGYRKGTFTVDIGFTRRICPYNLEPGTVAVHPVTVGFDDIVFCADHPINDFYARGVRGVKGFKNNS